MTAAPAGASNAPRLLDGLQLADALRAGIYRLFEQTDHLNKINVFPVPDGDTGTNLAMTLAAVLAALERAPEPDAGRLLSRVADAALDGARGNSGSILAQFLLGLADGSAGAPVIDGPALVRAAEAGARYARDAMSQPREGTLLTVLRTFADALQASLVARPDATPRDLVLASRDPLARALAATTSQLDALREARVVDAGAQGFVALLEGMTRYFETGETGTPTATPRHRADNEDMAGALVADAAGARSEDARYCTECLVLARDGAVVDLRQLRERLAPLGSSLVVGGSKSKAKVHIHTDDPQGVFAAAAGLGTLLGQKADDMRRQQGAAHHGRTQRVAVVTDSAADIPEQRVETLGIHVVPVRIHFGDRSYLDKVTMTPSEFYRELERNPDHPKTSQPPPGDFRRLYEFLASHYERVVSIALTARASGTHDAAVAASQRIAPAADGTPVVTVIDSHSVSCGQGLVAIAAAERALAGGSPEEVAEAAREASRHTRAFALLASVDAAVKGGRVPPLVRTLARALNLSIVLATQPDGRVKAGGALWGRRRLTERFARFVARRAPASPATTGTGTPRFRVLVGHGNAPQAAQDLAMQLASALPSNSVERCEITDMGTALGVHGGPGTLIVGLQAT
jgi:DegV family protein with EDD domain